MCIRTVILNLHRKMPRTKVIFKRGVEGMSSTETIQPELELIKVIQNCIESYSQKEGLTDKDWVNHELKRYGLGLEDTEIEAFHKETIDTIERNNQNIESINLAVEQGITKEAWFKQKIQEASVGRSVQEVGQYLQRIDHALNKSNELMNELILNHDGSINRNQNLDGFIFEQHQANTFNLDVALKGGEYKAEALKPKRGERFKRDSVDLVIKDEHGNIVKKYQAKFSTDAKHANRAFKIGNYKFQRKLVAKGQVDYVTKGTDTINIKQFNSTPLSKQEGKVLQKFVQDGKKIEVDWNYKLKDLTKHMTKNVAVAGMQSAAIAVGYDVVYKTLTDTDIEIDEVVEVALKTGADTGVKTSVTIALKVASERGLLKAIPPGTPPAIIANVATVAIENLKVLNKVAMGEMSVMHGLQQMERVTVATTAGLVGAELGALKGVALGGLALSWIPLVGSPVGAILGGIIGGTVGYMAGSTIGQKIVETAQKVRRTVTNTLKAGARAVKTGLNKAKNFVKSLF
jgi:hypothetical protein